MTEFYVVEAVGFNENSPLSTFDNFSEAIRFGRDFSYNYGTPTHIRPLSKPAFITDLGDAE